MSGDVQPRKRKDKKRKKDDLGVEEPRGTAAVFGEGDVFIHSPHDHGTGGHWCAKIIFFSLLAVLVTLIGMIILENRGLSELEANSVESRYSGVLDGWLEDSHDDDHHDVHTLELKHHDDENNHNDISNELDHDEADDDHDDGDGGDHEDNEELDESEAEDDDDDEEESDADDKDDSLELHEKAKDQEADNDDDEEESDAGDDDDDSLELREKAKDQEEEDYNEDELSQENDDDDEDNYDENEQNDDQDEQKSVEEADEDDQFKYKKYYESYKAARDEDNDDDDKNDDLRKVDEVEDGEDESTEKNLSSDDLNDEEDDDVFKNDEIEDSDDEKDIIDNDDSINDQDAEEVEKDEDEYENNDTEEEDEDHDVKEEENIEVEKIEREFSEEDEEEPPESDEVLPQDESSDADLSKEEEVSNEVEPDDIDEDDVEMLEPDDDVSEIVEHITAPPGKPLVEVEEEATSEKPPDTLAEEEEYEKQQEELRRQKEEGSHVWLKVVVGGALLVATHAVVRRATAPRDSPVTPERVAREDTPITDRRMTLIAEETPLPAVQRSVPQEPSREIITMEKTKSVSVVQSAPEPEVESEEEIEVEVDDEDIKQIPTTEEETNAVKEKDFEDNELYSDEDVEEEEIVNEKEEAPKVVDSIQSVLKEKTPEPDDLSEDVEIIDDEQLDDEMEEEVEDEEEIFDVDDAELLSRLEAKYGKLPAPERAGRNPKDGGESLEDDWPGEPSDPYWRRQLDQAEKDFQKGEWSSAVDRAGAEQLRASARARWLSARALDALAEAKRDNRLLTRAIAAYLDLLKMNERLSDKKLLDVTSRTLNRIQFRGNYLSAEPVYRLLIRRFPNDVNYRNNLTVSFLMANRADLAEDVLKETLKMWPNDRVALAHLGFVLKTQHNRLEEAVDAFQKALDGDTGPATEPRFYYHLGDSLLLLGRYKEAQEVHKRGAAFGHFLSPSQRSLYNVDRLKSRPWWKVDETPYVKLARDLEKSWKDILKEGEAAWALYEKEKEGLKERGEWSQLDLFVRGREVPDRCKRAPVTCTIVKSEPSASGCRRGQVKFSAMAAGTHVRPHVGPTNCRLRMHLGLSNTKDTYLRVDQETRQWQTGKVLLFDDSFEHEVWHNGTGTRLVLIVDVWHPDLTPSERRQLPAI